MNAMEFFFYINDVKWRLDYSRGDYFATRQILQELHYAIESVID